MGSACTSKPAETKPKANQPKSVVTTKSKYLIIQ